MSEELEHKNALTRRTMVKGAAWSMPVIATAIAAPLASASVNGASVTWGSASGSLLEIGLLNGAASGGALANVSVLPSGPQGFTVNNPTPGSIQGPLTGTVSISWASGVPLLSTKGFGVYSVAGSPANVSSRVETYRGLGLIGTYNTTQNISVPESVNGTSLFVPVTFGLTSQGVLGVPLLMTFDVSLTLRDANNTVIGSSAPSTLTLPIGINLL